MKILAISDVESKYLWDYFQPEKLEGVDLILSCGDLKASYLTLLATFTHAPLLYVHGNHDTDYQRRPPEGCTCIEDTVYEVNGVRIAGLGGSVRYKPGPFQYTQREMNAVLHGCPPKYAVWAGRYHRCPCACPRLQRRRRPRTYGF